MLTRNLYELDEVVAALQLCLCNRWPRALFWAWELFVSEEIDLLQKTLTDSWLSYGAPYDLTVFQDIAKIRLDSEGGSVVSIVCRIMDANKRAGSLGPQGMLNTASKKPRVTKAVRDPKTLKRRAERSAAFVASLSDSESLDRVAAAQFWISLDSACRSYWYSDAFWLLQAAQPILSADAIWSAIQIAGRGSNKIKDFLKDLATNASPNPVDQIRYQAAAIATLCRPTKSHPGLLETLPNPGLPLYMRDWISWTDMVGRRRARIHAIPVEALHKETTRGSISSSYTNIVDIREPVLLVTGGCAWWRRTTKEAGFVVVDEDTIEVPDDEDYEQFYATNFPDDIPDEWSAADQQKSHGRGLAESAPAPPEQPTIREDALDQREWLRGIHVPARKNLNRRGPAKA